VAARPLEPSRLWIGPEGYEKPDIWRVWFRHAGATPRSGRGSRHGRRSPQPTVRNAFCGIRGAQSQLSTTLFRDFSLVGKFLSLRIDAGRVRPSTRTLFAFSRRGPCVPSRSARGRRMLFIRFVNRAVQAVWRSHHEGRKQARGSGPVDSFQTGHWRVRSPRALASSASRLSAFPRQWIRPEARTGPPGTKRGAAWAQIESRRRDRRNNGRIMEPRPLSGPRSEPVINEVLKGKG
jgi:hypothetical protein